jgi:DNA polymerase-3 subunit delta
VRLRPEQLAGHLEQALLPVYLVSGDEALLVQESCDLIRRHCREQGCSEREILEVDKQFDWQQLIASAASLSLFADRKLVELRLPDGKPGAEGSKALCEYLAQGSDDILLVVAGRIDKQSTNSKWFKALDRAGAVIQVWPVDRRQLPRWLEQRLRAHGLRIEREALDLLCERVEGNLLAAMQEVEKLRLLATGDNIDTACVTDAVLDNARFNLYGMVDSALGGESRSCLRMLRGLRGEGTEPAVICWALSRELHMLRRLRDAHTRGQDLRSLFRQWRIWDSKAALYQAALARHDDGSLATLLELAVAADGSIKGYAGGNPWDNLAALLLALASGNAPLAPRLAIS